MKPFLPILILIIIMTSGCLTTTALPGEEIQIAVQETLTALVAEVIIPVPEATTTPRPIDKATEIPTETILSLETPETDCSPPVSDFEIGFVTDVIDGDTIEVTIDSQIFTVRYIGIDTPEPGEPGGMEAKAKNSELVSGQMLTLGRDVSETDRYDRLLRYVFLSDGTFVNAELVRLGYARAQAYQPDVRCQDMFEQLEKEAQASGVRSGDIPVATVIPTANELSIQVVVDASCSQFNAPGDDNKNMNEEYVCFTNQGTESVEMVGWMVKDSYGWSFTFPDFMLSAGERVRIHTGCGTNIQGDLYWCRDETAVWNNGGDCVYLLDEAGEKLSEYCY